MAAGAPIFLLAAFASQEAFPWRGSLRSTSNLVAKRIVLVAKFANSDIAIFSVFASNSVHDQVQDALLQRVLIVEEKERM